VSLVLRRLGKRYGERHALRGVDLEVQAGEAVALLGPNGSGKSTLLALVAGLRVPTEGSASIDGVPTRDPRARTRLGVLPERPALPRNHRLSTLLRALGADVSTAAELGLDAQLDAPLGALSAGQYQRAALALALAGSPGWLVLDEPLTALDTDSCARVVAAITKRVQGGAGLLLATHRPKAWTALIDRSLSLLDGALVGPS